MLVVDPVKRISIPEIVQHPFYTKNLASYLTPLPAPKPVLGQLSVLATPPKVLDFEIIEGIGKIEDDIVEDLARRINGITKQDVWDALRKDDGVQGNAVKVAYMLLRDKRRQGKDCKTISRVFSCFSGNFPSVAEFAEAERAAQLEAMDVCSHLAFLGDFVESIFSA